MVNKFLKCVRNINEYQKGTISFCAGALVWLVSAYLSDWTDPQAKITYWQVSYPIILGIAGFLGFLFPIRPWRWALYLIAAQLIMGIITTTGGLNMLPIGIIIHVIMALPCSILCYIGAWISKRIIE